MQRIGDEARGAVGRTRPTILDGGKTVVGGGVRNAVAQAPSLQRQHVGIAQPHHAERAGAGLLVVQKGQHGLVALVGSVPTTVEHRAEHRHDADGQREAGEDRRDLAPAEPIARQVHVERDDAERRAHRERDRRRREQRLRRTEEKWNQDC